jgi:carbonic anhydrase
MKKLSVIFSVCLSILAGYGIYYFMPTDKNISVFPSSSLSKSGDTVLNLENSPLYAAIVADDRVFETTYVAQPEMLAARKAVIATCMDHRLNDFLGSVTKGTYILRNAGGRVTEDWIRSIIILYKLLEVEEIFLIQHTDCGMQKFTDGGMKDLLQGSSGKAELVKNCNVTLEPLENNSACDWKNTHTCAGKKACVDYKCIDWLTIKEGLFASVLEDVTKIRNHPLIPSNIPIYGFIFDVLTGHLTPVPEAMEAGKAKPLACAF